MKTPICNCPNCNAVGTHKVQLFRRGAEGHAYLCDFHFFNEESYYTKNNNRQGTNKVNGNTIGVEFEVSKATEKARIEFTASGYLPTHDSTVEAEFKSPIMYGLNSLAKHCVTFERLIAEGQLEIDSRCGTHLHVGNVNLTPEKVDYVRRFYHSLFIPLCNAMQAEPEKTARLFGRGFNYWAEPISEGTNPRAHTNFINLQHDYTVEFRMCKFQTADQYMQAAKFAVAVVECVMANFIEHFDEEPKDARRYPTKTAYRKHKAQVTANKLVKLFAKFTNN